MLHQGLYILSLFSFSQSSVLIKFSGIPPQTLGFWRLLGASLLLLSLRSISSQPKLIVGSVFQSRWWILVTGLFLYLHLWSYAYSAQNTSIAHCMILFALNPLFTAIGAKIFFREPIEKNVVTSYIFAFAGLYFLVNDRVNLSETSWMGELSALLSGLLYSIYTLFSKRSRQNVNNWDFGIGTYFVSAICFYVTTLFTQAPFTGYSTQSWLAVIGIILIPTLLGHSLFSYLINYLNINWMSCGKLIEPTFSVAVAFFVFNETVSTNTVLAFTLTSLAVLFLFFKIEFHGRLKVKILLRNK